MKFFKSTQTKDELLLVFDIRSSSVGGAIFSKSKSDAPKVLASFRAPIPVKENLSPERLLSLTVSALESVVENISKKGVGAPSRIFCVLSSPWHVSQTRVVTLAKNAPFVFTDKIADELTQKEIALVKAEYALRYQDSSSMLRPIELKNIKTKLSGYETSKPIGKMTTDVEMNIFISVSAEDVCKKIEAAIEKHYPVKEVKFSTFTMSAFAALRDMYHDRENFLLIYVGGEVTEITMVKKSILRESASYPLGTNYILRGIAANMNTTLPEAKSFLSLHKDGHAGESISQSLDPIIDQLKKDWLRKFQEALANLSNDISIPSSLYLMTETEVMEFFIDTIKGEQFNQYTLTESKFEIIPCTVETLHGGVFFTQGAEFDSYLALDVIYINRFFN